MAGDIHATSEEPRTRGGAFSANMADRLARIYGTEEDKYGLHFA